MSLFRADGELSTTHAEESVFAHFFQGNASILLVVDPDDFADRLLKNLFIAAKEFYEAEGSCDFFRFDNWMQQKTWYVERNCFEMLLAIITARLSETSGLVPIPSIVYCVRHARIAREAAKVKLSDIRPGEMPKKLIELSEELGSLLPPEETTKEQLALSIADSGQKVKTGFDGFDSLTKGGLMATGLSILAARPSLGKTSLALNIAASCLRSSRTVLFISLEMSEAELWTRILCSQEGKEEEDVRQNAAAYLDRAPTGLTVSCRSELSAIVSTILSSNADLIILDYLQLVETDADGDVERISKVSRTLKNIALSRSTPILALSQLSETSKKTRSRESLYCQTFVARDRSNRMRTLSRSYGRRRRRSAFPGMVRRKKSPRRSKAPAPSGTSTGS